MNSAKKGKGNGREMREENKKLEDAETEDLFCLRRLFQCEEDFVFVEEVWEEELAFADIRVRWREGVRVRMLQKEPEERLGFL